MTEKRDGENTTLYPDNAYHARSLDGHGSAYQSWIANMWAERFQGLPSGFKVCGENLFARHSIGYEDLDSYFEVFAVIDAANSRLPWGDVEGWTRALRLKTVPVLYRGRFDELLIRNLWAGALADHAEGYVVAVDDAFDMSVYGRHVAKFVRTGLVQSQTHWTKGWVKNGLARG